MFYSISSRQAVNATNKADGLQVSSKGYFYGASPTGLAPF